MHSGAFRQARGHLAAASVHLLAALLAVLSKPTHIPGAEHCVVEVMQSRGRAGRECGRLWVPDESSNLCSSRVMLGMSGVNEALDPPRVRMGAMGGGSADVAFSRCKTCSLSATAVATSFAHCTERCLKVSSTSS